MVCGPASPRPTRRGLRRPGRARWPGCGRRPARRTRPPSRRRAARRRPPPAAGPCRRGTPPGRAPGSWCRSAARAPGSARPAARRARARLQLLRVVQPAVPRSQAHCHSSRPRRLPDYAACLMLWSWASPPAPPARRGAGGNRGARASASAAMAPPASPSAPGSSRTVPAGTERARASSPPADGRLRSRAAPPGAERAAQDDGVRIDQVGHGGEACRPRQYSGPFEHLPRQGVAGAGPVRITVAASTAPKAPSALRASALGRPARSISRARRAMASPAATACSSLWGATLARRPILRHDHVPQLARAAGRPSAACPPGSCRRRVTGPGARRPRPARPGPPRTGARPGRLPCCGWRRTPAASAGPPGAR